MGSGSTQGPWAQDITYLIQGISHCSSFFGGPLSPPATSQVTISELLVLLCKRVSKIWWPHPPLQHFSSPAAQGGPGSWGQAIVAREGSWLGKDPGWGEVMVGELDPGWGPVVAAGGGAKGSPPAEGVPCSRFLPSPPPVPNYSGQALSLVTSGTPTLVPQVHGAAHQPTQGDPSGSACTWGGGARERCLRFCHSPCLPV